MQHGIELRSNKQIAEELRLKMILTMRRFKKRASCPGAIKIGMLFLLIKVNILIIIDNANKIIDYEYLAQYIVLIYLFK